MGEEDDYDGCMCNDPDCPECGDDLPCGSCDECGADLFSDDAVGNLCGQCDWWLSQSGED